jgi:HEAT repeat protein
MKCILVLTVLFICIASSCCVQPDPGLMRLIDDLTSEDADERAAAASFLGSFGAKAIGAIDSLRTATKDTDPLVRVESARALWRINKQFEDYAVQTLVQEVNLAGTRSGNSAISYLGEIKSKSHDSVGKIRKILNNGDGIAVRIFAADSMYKIEPSCATETMPILLKGLEDTRYPLNVGFAANVLSGMGRHAVAAIPRLRFLQNDENDHIRGAAKAAVRKLTNFE